eukprot:TRINITY_DN821_c0_g1_i15.p1 TRINITY_DN821_c0_g1~~TRINITY_DN821_c0_g1_i15.p1  ORF type:complete len:233 (+),score=41.50 TRINITY_DN821_c0_g1_i15:203-901(+)
MQGLLPARNAAVQGYQELDSLSGSGVELHSVEVDLEAPLLPAQQVERPPRRKHQHQQQQQQQQQQRYNAKPMTLHQGIPAYGNSTPAHVQREVHIGELRQHITGPIDGPLYGANVHGQRAAAAEAAALKAEDEAVRGALEVATAVAAERIRECGEGVQVLPHPGNRFEVAGASLQDVQTVATYDAAVAERRQPGYHCAEYTSVYDKGEPGYVCGEYTPAEYTVPEYKSVYDM